MKKILTLLALLSAFLLTACGPSYDYSSAEEFRVSINKQAAKEDIEKRDVIGILMPYVITKVLESPADYLETVLACEDEEELAKEIWLCVKKHTNGKTLRQMQDDTFPLFVAMTKDGGRDMDMAMEDFCKDFAKGFLGVFEKKR